MLALLAVRREIRRDEVVDLLWRGVEEEKARNAFRQALHRLRSAVGADVLPQDRELLRLVPGGALQIDLTQFETAAAAGRLDEAMDLFRGDFLEGVELGESAFDVWADSERTRLRGRFRAVLRDAVGAATASGKWTDAIACSRRLLALAPFDSSAAELAATTLVSAGRREEARDLLRQFGSNLHAELGVPLPAELQSLANRLERHKSVDAAGGRGAATWQLPFVAREAELARVVTLCRRSATSGGGFVLLDGEPGSGKSRFMSEVGSHLRSLGGVTVLTGRECGPAYNLPYFAFVEALRPLVRAPGVLGASRHLLAEAARLLPELRDEIDLPASSAIEDETSRLRFFEGIAALVDAAAFERPIALVLDDMQHASPSSLDLLSYLRARLVGSAVTMVVGLSSAEAPNATRSRLVALAGGDSDSRDERAFRIVLEPVSTAIWLDALASVPASELTDATRERVIQRSEGNPGQLVELLRRALAGENIAAHPVRLEDLYAERAQRLSPAHRRLAVVLALLGRPVSISFASAASHLPERATLEGLDTLIHQGLVERGERDECVAGAVAGRVMLDLAGNDSRAFLAGWIAEALKAQPITSHAELARFLAIAGRANDAFSHFRQAAFDALALGAVAEAVQLLSSGRPFAAPEQQAEVESLLGALGSGRLRLAERSVDPASVPASAAETVNLRATPNPPEHVVGAADFQTRWVRLFPNWRMLLGAAVATLVLSALVLAARPSAFGNPGARSPIDTLLVADDHSYRVVTGDPLTGFRVSEALAVIPGSPAWVDSLDRQWVGLVEAPNSTRVALARVSPSGSDIYVISADRRDTVRLVDGQGEARPLAWSPDGKQLLASVGRRDADYDSDLYAFVVDGGLRHAIDTSSERSITEAQWSPDGSRVAWVARVGAERQLEVFVSDAAGRNARNISRHPAEDREIGWSPTGKSLVFTSDRDGNADLYTVSFPGNQLRRLTSDAASDEAGAFSSDGRFIAFESTRGGVRAVHVVPAQGGKERRVHARPFSLVRWMTGHRRFIDRVRIRQPIGAEPGDTLLLRAVAVDQLDDSIDVAGATWTALDSGVARLLGSDASAGEAARIVARRPGIARIEVTVGGWRFDTAYVRVGRAPIVVVDSASPSERQWRTLGAPSPGIEAGGVFRLTADREWDSGIMSRASVPLLPGLRVFATLDLPRTATRDPSMTVSLAIVALEDAASVDSIAPQFLRYATIAWQSDANRLVYSVGREVFTEPVSALGLHSLLDVRLEVERDSTVSFFLAGQRRWRSTLRVIGTRQSSRVQLWIAGRATGNLVRVVTPGMTLGVPE